MAIYHLSVQVISRGKGRSCVAASAYRAGEKLDDARQGLTYDYTRRHDVRDTFIVIPDTAPAWIRDRQALWTAVDAAEKRKDAQTAREVNVALPRELTPEQQREVVQEFVQSAFISQGMVADVAIHEGHNEHEPNPHAHILLTTREVSADGFGPKNRAWNAKDLLVAWRNQWEHDCNAALEAYGHSERINAHSLAEQGIDRLPTVHEGSTVRQMEARGVTTERAGINREIRTHQSVVVELETVRQERKKLEQVQQRIGREEAWRKKAGWPGAPREFLRAQEEQAGKVLTRQDIQTMQRQNHEAGKQRQPVWQEAQRRVEDARKTLSDAKQQQQRLASQIEQGQKAQAVIQRKFSGVRGVWARWRGKAEYQEQQTRVETGLKAEKQLAAEQFKIPQLEVQVTQGQKHWEQMDKEHQEFTGRDRRYRALLQYAYTPEELQVRLASDEARRVARSACADQEWNR